jgi:hypothetical protein
VTAGTVSTLPTPLTLRPATILRPVPLLSRDQRRCLLEELAGDECIGTPHGDAIVTTLLAAFAAEALTPAEAAAKWDAFLGEYRRVQAVEAGDPWFADLQPGLAQEDCAAALDDILDGTNKLTGDRF